MKSRLDAAVCIFLFGLYSEGGWGGEKRGVTLAETRLLLALPLLRRHSVKRAAVCLPC